jgi:hypothetical protein
LTTPILQEFLRLRLLDIGPHDDRLVKLAEAAQELSTSFAAFPRTALPVFLAAVDPNVEADTALLGVSVLMERHWPTYRSAFQGEPITLYRAVALEAVAQAVELQPELAIAVFLVSRNLLPHMAVGNEATVFAILAQMAEEQVNGAVALNWDNSFEPPILEMPPLAPVTPKKINKEQVAKRVTAASGPNGRDNVSLDNANPHWTNSAGIWSYDFAERMSELLIDLHDSAAAGSVAVKGKADAAMGAAITDMLSHMSTWVVAQSERLNRVTGLVWWRQALHSESANMGYRSLPWELVPVHMAIDIANMLPAVYPTSVESFLTESVLALQSTEDQDEPIRMSSLHESMVNPAQVRLREALSSFAGSRAGRLLLVQSAQSSDGPFAASSLGLADDFQLPAAQWAVWILREIKALTAVNSVVSPTSSSPNVD